MLRSSGYGRSSPGVLSSSRAETQEFHIGSATVALEMRFGARPHTRLCALQRAVGGRPKPGASRGRGAAIVPGTSPRQSELIKCALLLGRNVMGRATAHPNHQCISREDITGTEVYGSDGKNIGEIDHLIIDKISGRVGYAVMSFGGFLGLGHSHYPIPWGALSYDKSLGGFRTNITEGQLRDAPEFSDDSWQDRDWEARTHRHYGAPGYWETRTGV